ncbi:MAG: septum formation initiator family protein [Candidatus Xiphinematobacter sp.]|nr:MAG: septum formation initiator family protein [Candidatus Xiphinematobacter sp.]QQY10584.1 MAG: septum formation initiator family protein [Candidatus Xiphinematobacter sp.]
MILTRCQRRANRWHVINQFLTFAVVLGGVTMLGLLFVPILDRTMELKGVLRRKEQELQVALLLKKRREREVRLLRSDPAYLEMIARDKLDLMRSGEIIFRRLDRGPKNTTREVFSARDP